MKKMKVMLVVAVLVTVIYAILVIVLGDKFETILGFGYVAWFTLPFKVSAWWNLCLLPVVVMTIVYCFSKNQIVGREPNFPGWPAPAEFKYEARLSVYLNTVIATLVALSSIILTAFLFLFWSEGSGPISSLVIATITWVACYCSFSFGSEFLKVLVWDVYHEGDMHNDITSSLTRKYEVILAIYIKMGIVKTLPFILGLTCGFIVKQVISKTVGIFRMIGVSQID